MSNRLLMHDIVTELFAKKRPIPPSGGRWMLSAERKATSRHCTPPRQTGRPFVTLSR